MFCWRPAICRWWRASPAGTQGSIYNVNADQMAVSCALGWQADRLLFLTDVPGVKDGNDKVLGHLTIEGIKELVSSGVASGGMQAKLESAAWCLEGGLAEVVIASGRSQKYASA